MEKTLLATEITRIVPLTDEQLEVILGYFHPFSAGKDAYLMREGEVSQHMNFVLSGCLRIFFINDAGQEATRHLAFEGQYATGLASFITGSPAFEFMQALEDTELLRIERNDFYYLLNLIPIWERFYRYYLEDAYMNNLRIFRREITKDAKERYKELLARNPDVISRLPNKIVASYLNMKPETLSRMKRG